MRKIPMRKCVATQEQLPKKELIRIVRTPQMEVKIDESGRMNGRGAYLKRSQEAVELAKKKKSLARSLECEIPQEIYGRTCWGWPCGPAVSLWVTASLRASRAGAQRSCSSRPTSAQTSARSFVTNARFIRFRMCSWKTPHGSMKRSDSTTASLLPFWTADLRNRYNLV